MSDDDESVINNYLRNQSITTYGKLSNCKNKLVVIPSDSANDFVRMVELKKV